MLPTSKLFEKVACPDHSPPTASCSRQPCLFSHTMTRKAVNPPKVAAKGSNPTASQTTTLIRPIDPKRQPSSLRTRPGGTATSSTFVPKSTKALVGSRNVLSKPKSSAKPQAGPSRLPAHTSSTTAPRLVVSTAIALHTPVSTRQKLLQALFDQFVLLYSALPSGQALAARDALAQEAHCYQNSANGTYRNSVINTLARLKKRPPAVSTEDERFSTGTVAEWETKQNDRKKLASGLGQLSRVNLEPYVLTRETMLQLDYIVDVPQGVGSEKPTANGELQVCERCGVKFLVDPVPSAEDGEACLHHWGRPYLERVNGVKTRVYSCCRNIVGASGCSRGFHCFSEKDPEVLHQRAGFITTSALSDGHAKVKPISIAAFDCEMVYTTAGHSLARVTVVAPSPTQTSTDRLDLDVLLDEWVLAPPAARILDLVTRFSGIREEDLDPLKGKAVMDLAGVRDAMGRIGVGPDTILCGHGLENDLRAMRLVHQKCVDSVSVFPHPRGLPMRQSLRNLASTHLKQFVQNSDPTIGHSSAEDAGIVLQLLRFKIIEDEQRQKPRS